MSGFLPLGEEGSVKVKESPSSVRTHLTKKKVNKKLVGGGVAAASVALILLIGGVIAFTRKRPSVAKAGAPSIDDGLEEEKQFISQSSKTLDESTLAMEEEVADFRKTFQIEGEGLESEEGQFFNASLGLMKGMSKDMKDPRVKAHGKPAMLKKFNLGGGFGDCHRRILQVLKDRAHLFSLRKKVNLEDASGAKEAAEKLAAYYTSSEAPLDYIKSFLSVAKRKYRQEIKEDSDKRYLESIKGRIADIEKTESLLQQIRFHFQQRMHDTIESLKKRHPEIENKVAKPSPDAELAKPIAYNKKPFFFANAVVEGLGVSTEFPDFIIGDGK